MADGIGVGLAKALLDSFKPHRVTAPYTTKATVQRVADDGTIYVMFPGGEDETPCGSTTVAVKAGDVVDVAVSHDDTHITGNRSDQASATSTVDEVEATAVRAAATATDFIRFDGDAIVISDMSRPELARNVRIDSDSVDVRDGDTTVASFGRVTRLGPSDAPNVRLDSSSIAFATGTETHATLKPQPYQFDDGLGGTHVETPFEILGLNGLSLRGSNWAPILITCEGTYQGRGIRMYAEPSFSLGGGSGSGSNSMALDIKSDTIFIKSSYMVVNGINLSSLDDLKQQLGLS